MLQKAHRKTKFLTVLNFKGGVGKTTLTANLAASLGLAKRGLRVLLIDVDFQGTLSQAAVDPTLVEAQRKHGAFVNQLLLNPPADGLLSKLWLQMNQVPGVDVILADDSLAPTDFELQARFVLDPASDPRYQIRKHLHRPEVLEKYDLVVFDCPPRVTTSVVNAVACSDYVLIPTRLDRGSIAAVSRTWKWMLSLKEHCAAALLGVVACHATTWRTRLTNADTRSFENLRGEVKSSCGADLLLKAYVPYSTDAIGPEPGRVASLFAEGQQVFAPVVAELRKRMDI